MNGTVWYLQIERQPGKQVVTRMSTNMVNQIREAEQQAEEFLSDARIRSKKIVSDAQASAQAARERTLTEAQLEADRISNGAADAAADEIAKIRAEFSLETSRLQESADQNRKRAVQAVVERIVNANGNR